MTINTTCCLRVGIVIRFPLLLLHHRPESSIFILQHQALEQHHNLDTVFRITKTNLISTSTPPHQLLINSSFLPHQSLTPRSKQPHISTTKTSNSSHNFLQNAPRLHPLLPVHRPRHLPALPLPLLHRAYLRRMPLRPLRPVRVLL